MAKWLGDMCDIRTKLQPYLLQDLFRREYEATIKSISPSDSEDWLASVVKFIKEGLSKVEEGKPVGNSSVNAWESFSLSLLRLFQFWISALEHGIAIKSHHSNCQLTQRSSFDMVALLLTLIRLRYMHVDDLDRALVRHPTKSNIEIIDGLLQLVPYILRLHQ